MKRLFAILLACSILFSLFSTVSLSAFSINDGSESKVEEEQIGEQENISQESIVCMDGEMPSHYVTQKQRFSLEEGIVVSYQINFSTDWDLVEYEAQGFEILSIVTDSESMTATIALDIEEELQEACLTITNEQNANKLYGLKSEGGYFISKESRDNLWDAYFYSGVEDGLYSMQEYIDLMNAYYGENVLASPENDLLPDEITMGNIGCTASPTVIRTQFTGAFTWEDDNGNTFPLRFVKVEVYNNSYPSSPTLLFSKYTDINGRISVAKAQNSATSYKVIVYTQGERVSVGNSNGMVYSAEKIVTSFTDTEVYVSMQVDMSTLAGQAMQISQAALFADRYAKEMNTTALSPVTICYPCPDEDNCCYYSSNDRIHILPEEANDDLTDVELEPYSSWDVIMHEYGHHVMHEFDIEGVGGEHYPEQDLALTYEKGDAIKIAWGEAYATIFSELVQQSYSSYLAQIDTTICNCAHDSYNGLEFHYETIYNESFYGETHEIAIICMLWDLFDPSNAWESFDEISFTHQEFWDLITINVSDRDNYSIHCFSDFSKYFLLKQPSRRDEFIALLSYYRISPDEIQWVENGDSVTIKWRKNGSVKYVHNNFVLAFYDAESDSPILSIGVTNGLDSYTLSASQLNGLKEFNQIYIIISATQTIAPVTGPYYSIKYYKIM